MESFEYLNIYCFIIEPPVSQILDKQAHPITQSTVSVGDTLVRQARFPKKNSPLRADLPASPSSKPNEYERKRDNS